MLHGDMTDQDASQEERVAGGCENRSLPGLGGKGAPTGTKTRPMARQKPAKLCTAGSTRIRSCQPVLSPS
jgi:hypothetical protein